MSGGFAGWRPPGAPPEPGEPVPDRPMGRRPGPSAAPPDIDDEDDGPSVLRFTFGFWTNTSWTDRRELSWPELIEVLTTHKVGKKEGDAIVPATFRGD